MTRHPLADLPDDIRDHIDRETEDNLARGMTPERARQAALKAFGSTAIASENTRAIWIPIWFDQLNQDLRYAARLIRRTPGTSLTAMLILALGIAVTSAVYSIARGVMLKPLPYANPDRIVSVWETTRGGARQNVIAPWNFMAWRERARSFDDIGMVGPYSLTWSLDNGAEQVTGFLATANVFRILGVSAALGRVYTDEEDYGPNSAVLVLDHQFWINRFGGRTDVIGSTVVAGGQPRVIVGVLPAGFTMEGVRGSFYAPYRQSPDTLRSQPGRGFSHALARLADGVPLERARAEMSTLASQLAAEQPRLNTGRTIRLIPVQQQTVADVRPAMLVLGGAVGLVLLLACANVAGLLLARSTARTRELGLRTALGAGRSRLVRQMLTESVLFACLSGAMGLALAAFLQDALIRLVSNRVNVPRLDQVTLDSGVVLFALVMSIGTGLIFGLVPAVGATGWRGDTLRETGGSRVTRRSQRLLSAFAAAQFALSVVLLSGAALLGLSAVKLQRLDPGFQADDVLTARVILGGERWNDDRVSTAFFSDAVDRMRALPGTRAAAGVGFLPLNGPGIGTSYWRSDRPRPGAGDEPATDVVPVTPGYFQAMGIRFVNGRDFERRDTIDSAPVAIVSEALVRFTFPTENPLGKRIHVNLSSLPGGGDVEVVGVVRDIAMKTLEDAPAPAVYVPHTQLPIGVMSFVVRTDADPLRLAPGVRGVVRDLDSTVAVSDVRTLRDLVDSTLFQSKAIALLLSAFALAALVLAAAGIYGVIAFSAARRTQEIGVRLALGARPVEIVMMVVKQAVVLASIGVAAGLVGALGLTRLLTRLLFNTAPADPLVFSGVVALLFAAAIAAAWLPARRASRVDPMAALRCD